MSVKIEQGSSYEGDRSSATAPTRSGIVDYWKWWVWIEGPDSELDQIDHVVYTLHRTFPNPVRTISDRASKFALKTAGWGVFRIHAKVVYKDGRESRLSHDLVLTYPDGTPTTA
jgi:transcription initiation factor IIF auxiliary subunit